MSRSILIAVFALAAAAPLANAQEIKPASQEEVATLTRQVKELQTAIVELQKKNDEMKSTMAGLLAKLNSQALELNGVATSLASLREDDKAVYNMLGQWKTALETKNGGHFLWGLARAPSGQLIQYGGWGSY